MGITFAYELGWKRFLYEKSSTRKVTSKFLLDLLWSKQGPINREGCGVPQNRGYGLVLERYCRDGGLVHREGCGVPPNGTPRDTVHLRR